MTIKIVLRTGNDAFSDGNKDTEIERILRAWLYRGLEHGTAPLPRDSNGNRVGSVTVTGR